MAHEVKVTRNTVRRAMDDIRQETGLWGAFTKDDLAHVIAQREDFSPTDIKHSVSRHVVHFLKNKEMVVVGSVERESRGRPENLYRWPVYRKKKQHTTH